MSDLELRLLMLLAAGRAAGEAAEVLALDLRTTAAMLATLRQRLRVRSTAAAMEMVLGKSRG